jgi:hypothetical protein
MSEQQTRRAFECVEMKRRIPEESYAETRDMAPEELLAYFHRRVASSRFAALFREQPPPAGGRGLE